MAGQAGGPGKHLCFWIGGGQHLCGYQTRLAFRNCAGLVESNDAQFASFFQIDAAFDQDAAPSGCGQSADNCNRRSDN
ncbi:hypothetical protein SDC9_143567 [bioreactor metagenome]|uniref:Uncharacterized protein n=1 Tax=bioreactor metagenome TaxID=1076179 RepID=A0A645E3N5_9ZZZZ